MNMKTKLITMTDEEESNSKNSRRKHIAKYICLGIFAGSFILLLIAYEVTLAPPSQDEMAHCVFCDIIAGGGSSQSTKLEVETDEYVIFKDIKPASTHHYLCVPRQHIKNLKAMSKDDIPLINRMEAALKDFYHSKGIDTGDALFGFHMPPFISVNHLHMHGIAPRSTMSWMNSFIFRANSSWFYLVEDARKYLEGKSS